MGVRRGIAAIAATATCGMAWACTPPPPPPGQLDASAVLNSIPVANENGAGYNRDLFHYPTDADGNKCDTRAEVLLRDTLAAVLPTPGLCVFGGGQWYSAYDGVTTTNQADLEIDHVVALKEAWGSLRLG